MHINLNQIRSYHIMSYHTISNININIYIYMYMCVCLYLCLCVSIHACMHAYVHPQVPILSSVAQLPLRGPEPL